jgi:chromate reductase
VRVLGIAGSLRAGSYNRALLRAAVELAPAEMEIEAFEGLREIPLYDGDVEEAGVPEPVQRLAAAIAAADGVLLVTPEYNFGVPGVLKNALDWVSRRPAGTPLRGKPVALAGASGGAAGTARSQLELRPTLAMMGALVLATPNVMVANAGDKLDGELRLTDEPTREHLASLLAAFADWIRLVGRSA